jgi:hypothetical protein
VSTQKISVCKERCKLDSRIAGNSDSSCGEIFVVELVRQLNYLIVQGTETIVSRNVLVKRHIALLKEIEEVSTRDRTRQYYGEHVL